MAYEEVRFSLWLILSEYAIIVVVLGCRQVVRHMVLVHAFAGSIPAIPATQSPDLLVGFLCGWELYDRKVRRSECGEKVFTFLRKRVKKRSASLLA